MSVLFLSTSYPLCSEAYSTYGCCVRWHTSTYVCMLARTDGYPLVTWPEACMNTVRRNVRPAQHATEPSGNKHASSSLFHEQPNFCLCIGLLVRNPYVHRAQHQARKHRRGSHGEPPKVPDLLVPGFRARFIRVTVSMSIHLASTADYCESSTATMRPNARKAWAAPQPHQLQWR